MMALGGKLYPSHILFSPLSLQPNNEKSHFPISFPSSTFHPATFHLNQTWCLLRPNEDETIFESIFNKRTRHTLTKAFSNGSS